MKRIYGRLAGRRCESLLLALAADTVFEQAKARPQEPSPTLANPTPTTPHEVDPFLALTTLANALYTHACAPSLLRFPVCVVAGRCRMSEGEPV
ncbi:hypothetical protein JB92DRAFT_3059850, partial [Gautieria morchelliformis]